MAGRPRKCIVIVGDGMADYPIGEFGGKTPLQRAHKPNIDEITKRGRSGLMKTLLNGFPTGSDVANLRILGYDIDRSYTGRGSLEAAARGIKLGDRDLAFRCNLVYVKNGVMIDYAADHITSAESSLLIEELNQNFLTYGRFYTGVSYRNIFVTGYNADLQTTPPHDISGQEIVKHMIKPDCEEARRLNHLMIASKELLDKSDTNAARIRSGLRPGNMIWLWGQGGPLRLQPFRERYVASGGMISAVDLLRGLAIYSGMKVYEVQGATGYFDTNYEGKADCAIQALSEVDLIYVHVEAPDEAGHAGDASLKVKTIEDLDRRLVGRVLDALGSWAETPIVAFTTDHYTPVSTRTHELGDVPFSILDRSEADGVETFDEVSVDKGAYGHMDASRFMPLLLRR